MELFPQGGQSSDPLQVPGPLFKGSLLLPHELVCQGLEDHDVDPSVHPRRSVDTSSRTGS